MGMPIQNPNDTNTNTNANGTGDNQGINPAMNDIVDQQMQAQQPNDPSQPVQPPTNDVAEANQVNPLVQDQMLSQTPGDPSTDNSAMQPATEAMMSNNPDPNLMTADDPVMSDTNPGASAPVTDTNTVNQMNSVSAASPEPLDSPISGYNIPGVTPPADANPAVTDNVTNPVNEAPVNPAPMGMNQMSEAMPMSQPGVTNTTDAPQIPNLMSNDTQPVEQPMNVMPTIDTSALNSTPVSAMPIVNETQPNTTQGQTLDQLIASRGGENVPANLDTPPNQMQDSNSMMGTQMNSVPDAMSGSPAMSMDNNMGGNSMPATPDNSMMADPAMNTADLPPITAGADMQPIAGGETMTADTSMAQMPQATMTPGPTLDEVLPEVTSGAQLPSLEDTSKVKKDKKSSGGGSFTMIILILVFIIVGIFLTILGLQLSPNIDFNIPILADLLSSIGITQ